MKLNLPASMLKLDFLTPTTLGRIAILAIIYFVTARIGFLFPFEGGELSTLFWPALGTSIAAMMLFGLELWIGITLGALAIAISNQHSPTLTLLITLTHTIEPVLIAYTLKKIVKFNVRFDDTRDVVAFIIIAMVIGPVVGATCGMVSFILSPEGQMIVPINLWWQWWVAHAISILTLTPVLLTWVVSPSRDIRLHQLLELGVALGAVLIVSLLIFIPIPQLPIDNLPLGHVIFPFLIWLALRFSPREVSLASLGASLIAIMGTIHHTGPFLRADVDQNVGLLLTFVFAVVSSALLISSVLAQRRKAQSALQKSHEVLENRVIERTADLLQSNEKLQQEINERRHVESELQTARDQAIEALEFKTQILANVSHDVRTPLSVIMLRTQILQQLNVLEDPHKKNLDTIMVHAKELHAFFDNFLTEAQSQSGQIEINYQPFQPNILLRQVSMSLEPLIIRKGITYQSTIDPDFPTILYGDIDRLKQITYNLLGNALKFTEHGTISLRIYKRTDTTWNIAVTDTGIGMSEDAQKHIFDPFWQVDGSTTRTANRGVGLGLSIVNQLVTAMDGTVTVQSKLGKGSTFNVTLPLVIEGREPS